MSTNVSSARILVILGGALVFAALGFGVLTFMGAQSSSAGTAPLPTHHQAPRTTIVIRPAAKPKPVVRLLPNLPAPIRYALLRNRTIVVALYGNGAVDAGAAAEAHAGAALAHAGFVGLNVRKDRFAGPIADFSASAADPAVLFVRRPGVVVRQLDGYQDRQIVAQAAHDAR